MNSRERPGDQAGDPIFLDHDGAEGGASEVTPADWARLVVGSLRRRWAWSVGVFLLVMLAAATFYRLRAPTFRVEAKILAQRQPSVLAGGQVGGDDLPARSAWELIHRRENLVALIHQTGLLDGGAIDEGPGLGARLLALLRPPDVERKEEPIDVLVRALDKRLQVTVEEGTIQLRLDWPDAEHAYRLVQAALQGFLEARHVQEVASIDDVIAKMEGRTARLRSELDAAMASARRRAPAPVRAAAPRERPPSEEMVRLRSLLEAKARAARDVEEFRSRRLADLESQLTQARATLSEAHPTVTALRRDVEALAHESPQLRALREEERKVRLDYEALVAKEGSPSDGPVVAEPVPADGGAQREEDPRVRDLRLQYEQMTARLTSAHVDLDAARAAFKHRYNVIWPPEIPSEPHSPNPAKVFGAGLVAALLLALAAAVLPDLLGGRVVEKWQVERGLDLTVLAETPPSRKPPR